MNTAIKQVTRQALSGLGRLLEYPDENFHANVSGWRRAFSPGAWIAGSHIAEFEKDIAEKSTKQLEEIYTRTFDIAPMCNPYVTAHLYGDESFERGTLMTKLNERYAEDDFSTRGELPDHIRIILQFAPYFSLDEMSELVQYCLIKPVTEMCDSLKDQANPYYHVLQAVLVMLQAI